MHELQWFIWLEENNFQPTESDIVIDDQVKRKQTQKIKSDKSLNESQQKAKAKDWKRKKSKNDRAKQCSILSVGAFFSLREGLSYDKGPRAAASRLSVAKLVVLIGGEEERSRAPEKSNYTTSNWTLQATVAKDVASLQQRMPFGAKQREEEKKRKPNYVQTSHSLNSPQCGTIISSSS